MAAPIPAPESRLVRIAALAAFLAYAVTLLNALNIDGLSSLASDSVHYLLMARHLSPWGDPDPIAALVFAGQDYPPLFGLVLGLADAGNDFRAAHVLNGALLLAALPLLLRYVACTTGSPGIALAVTAVFAISPGAWMNTLDVLSENLYLALSLIVLLHAARREAASPPALATTGLLVALLVLTRTVGLAMLVAVVAAGLVGGAGARAKVIAAGVPAAIALSVTLLVNIAGDAGVPDQYVQDFNRIAAGESPHGRVEVGAYLLSQFATLYDAWLGNWLYYWSGATVFGEACLAAAGALGMAGVFVRLREGRLDAWYLLAYLAVILIWPHPGQTTRFLYPAAPLLLVAAVDATLRIGATVRARQRRYLAPLLILFLAAAVLPTVSYTWNRHRIGQESGLSNMTEFYRLPDLRAAELEASVHAQIAEDIGDLEVIVPEDERVMYFEPAYVALLARRTGLRLPTSRDPGAILAAARAAGARYLLLTRIDPRHWRPGQYLLTDLHGYEGWTEAIFHRASPLDGRPVSLLLRIRD